MQLCFMFGCVLMFSGISAVPVLDENSNEALVRVVRAPTFHKKHGHGGLLFGGGGNNYITNINNFGPHPAPHGPPDHGSGGSFAGSSAFAGGHGHSSAQSQSAAVSLGPFSAAFSQSQAQSGSGGEKRGRFFDYFDY